MTLSGSACVVLGGGGFLGTNFCRRLAANGTRVRAFGRSRCFPDDLDGVDWSQGSFEDTGALVAAMESCEIVFHLIHDANVPNSADQGIKTDILQNVVPSLGLLDVCRKLKVKRVIFVSSGGAVYGVAKQTPIPETAATDPISAYGIGKLTVEKYLALYERLHGLDFKILRVANAFGPFQLPKQSQGLIAAVLRCVWREEPIDIWGDGSVVRDYVFVDDILDALQAAAVDQSAARAFNIGTGRGRTVRDVIAAIETQLGKQLAVNWRDPRPIDVPSSVLSIGRSKEVLGWTPKTSFEEGLKQTIEWWRSRHGRL